MQDKEQLFAWCEEHTKEGSHVLYWTGDGEVIVEPKRSTRPLRYAYLKTSKASEIAEEFSEKFKLTCLHLGSYEWDLDKSVGVKVPVK